MSCTRGTLCSWIHIQVSSAYDSPTQNVQHTPSACLFFGLWKIRTGSTEEELGVSKEKHGKIFAWHGIAFGASEVFKLMEWLRAWNTAGWNLLRPFVLIVFEGLFTNVADASLFIFTSIPPIPCTLT